MIDMKRLSLRLGLCSALIVAAGLSAATSAFADASNCAVPPLTQPFLQYGDSNWYAAAPGESADNFAGTGWTLTGGATIWSVHLIDGVTGNVLTLPAGATAISPPMCVNSTFPSARTFLREFPDASLTVSVSYASQPGFQNVGELSGMPRWWSLSGSMDIETSSLVGWDQGTFELVNNGGSGSGPVQVYDFLVDPYNKG